MVVASAVINHISGQNVVLENRKVAHKPLGELSLMFLPHFDVFCDLFILNRLMATYCRFYSFDTIK